jgi:DNA-binding NarL/FixJ family response regulator
LLTSLESEDIQERALDSGANRFLIKGRVGGDRLLEIVREVSTGEAPQEQS